jgi:hypothetical protein
MSVFWLILLLLRDLRKKKREPGMVVHFCNPCNSGDGDSRAAVQGQFRKKG